MTVIRNLPFIKAILTHLCIINTIHRSICDQKNHQTIALIYVGIACSRWFSLQLSRKDMLSLLPQRFHLQITSVFDEFSKRSDQEWSNIIKPPITPFSIFPSWLLDEIRSYYSNTALEDLQGLAGKPPIQYVRIHKSRQSIKEIEQDLQLNGIEIERDSLLTGVWKVLSTPISLPLTNPVQNQRVMIQDKGSLLALKQFSINPHQIIYDACSAPGMKAQYILSQSQFLFRIIAADISANRMKRVLQIQDSDNSQNQLFPILCDSAHPPIRVCDQILLDAPCTSTGTFQRDPDLLLKITPEVRALYGRIQRQILVGLSNWIRKPTPLLYITCSLLPSEGEEQISWLLKQQLIELLPSPSTLNPGYSGFAWRKSVQRIDPIQHKTQGFFSAYVTLIPSSTK